MVGLRQRHPVNALGIRDLAGELARRKVDDHHARGACDEQAVPIGIEAKVVPGTVAAQRDGTSYVKISLLLRVGRQPCQQGKH